MIDSRSWVLHGQTIHFINSMFISETHIDQAVEKLAQLNRTTEEQVAQWQQEQPMLLAYLTSEPFDLLIETEREYFFYLATVLYLSAVEQTGLKSPIDEDAIGAKEEVNWGLIQLSNAKDFRQRMDAFFEDYFQEDLLAFVEDALIDDEDSNLTEEGRELMAVGLKTLIDCLTDE